MENTEDDSIASKETILNQQFELARQKARTSLDVLYKQIDDTKRTNVVISAGDEYRIRQERISRQNTINEDIHCTDYGNALRMLQRFGSRILYCPAQDSWYIWDGVGIWDRDLMNKIRELSRDVLIQIYDEARIITDSDKRSALAKWAIICEKPDHVTACLKELQARPTITAKPEKFDNDITLFNLQNHTYDLLHHTILPHDRENFITKQVPYIYDPAATCPHFLSFLDRIFRSRPDKNEIIEYIQKAVGYTLTGDVSQQVIFLLHGTGSNGKSTLIETLRLLMGDYGTVISATSLITKKNDSVRNDIARLPSIRFVSSSENAKGTVLDEELIKNITGGDQIAARFLFHEEFTFHPVLKLWWAFNHAPGIRDMTHSLWRRLKMIPFEERIPDEERIDQKIILARHQIELPGIFNWAVDGLKKYQETGLNDITAIKNAVKEFKDNQDRLHDFIQDCCEVINQDGIEGPSTFDISIKVSELYNIYVEWAAYNNEKMMSQKRFSMELLERGFKKTHTREGNIYHGLQRKK